MSNLFSGLADFVSFTIDSIDKNNIPENVIKFRKYLSALYDKKPSKFFDERIEILSSQIESVLTPNLDKLKANDLSFMDDMVLRANEKVFFSFGQVYKLIKEEKKDAFEEKYIELIVPLISDEKMKEEIITACLGGDEEEGGDNINLIKVVKDAVDDMKPVVDEFNRHNGPIKDKLRTILGRLSSDEKILGKMDTLCNKLDKMGSSGKLNKQIGKMVSSIGGGLGGLGLGNINNLLPK